MGGKVKHRELIPSQRQGNINLLMRTLEECGLDECGREFLADLLMESEVTMFARRISIARLLLQGNSFKDICEQLRAGMDTVIAVDRWLSAKMYGYRSIVGFCRGREKKEERNELYDFLTLRELRKKYPGRHALIDLILGDS